MVLKRSAHSVRVRGVVEMKRWIVLVSVAMLVLCAGLGCSKKDKDDPVVSGGLTLTTYVSPPGGSHENGELPITVALSANYAGALIYYTASSAPGNVPADPDLNSTVYDAATPIIIDAGYANNTFIIKYFGLYTDPKTHNTEQENPFNETAFRFRLDTTPPNCYITPGGGTYTDPSDVVILITADDNIDMPVDIRIKYTIDDTDPKTSGTVLNGSGDGTAVTWPGGTMKVRAYAIDLEDNESNEVSATFYLNAGTAVMEVLNLINAARAGTALAWDPFWAAGCNGHAQQIYTAEKDGTVGYVSAGDNLVAWWNENDSLKRQLRDFDGNPATGYFLDTTANATGDHASGPVEFVGLLQGNAAVWAELMDPSATKFGCGFYETVWEAMWE